MECNWISIEDKLPKKDNLYLVCCQTMLPDKPFVSTGWYDPTFGWSLVSRGFIEGLSHWMEIPKPPKIRIPLPKSQVLDL